MKKLLAAVAGTLVLLTTPASAVYNANLAGVLAFVAVYTEGDYIYFTLNNQPTSHPTCNPAYFVVPETVPTERRKMIFSRLLSAYAMKEAVNIGYDSTGDCIHVFIRVHRVG